MDSVGSGFVGLKVSLLAWYMQRKAVVSLMPLAGRRDSAVSNFVHLGRNTANVGVHEECAVQNKLIKQEIETSGSKTVETLALHVAVRASTTGTLILVRDTSQNVPDTHNLQIFAPYITYTQDRTLNNYTSPFFVSQARIEAERTKYTLG